MVDTYNDWWSAHKLIVDNAAVWRQPVYQQAREKHM